MSGWDADDDGGTRGPRRAQAQVRYGLVAPLVAGAPLWVDLGCGLGADAHPALAGGAPRRAVLIDNVAGAADEARAALGLPAATTTCVTADLETDEGLRAVRDAAGELSDGAVITCFDTLGALGSFVGVVDLLADAAQRGATVVLSVPDHQYVALEDPLGRGPSPRTMWGPGAVAELRRLLPEPQTTLRQVALAGSAIVPEAVDAGVALAPVEIPAALPGVHLVLAAGPRAPELAPQAAVVPADADADRRHDVQAAADLAVLRIWSGRG